MLIHKSIVLHWKGCKPNYHFSQSLARVNPMSHERRWTRTERQTNPIPYSSKYFGNKVLWKQSTLETKYILTKMRSLSHLGWPTCVLLMGTPTHWELARIPCDAKTPTMVFRPYVGPTWSTQNKTDIPILTLPFWLSILTPTCYNLLLWCTIWNVLTTCPQILPPWVSRVYGICTLSAAICILKGGNT